MQPIEQVLVGPLAAMARERIRIGEARGVLADRLADHPVKVRADPGRAALVDRVTAGALGEDLLARRRIGGGEQRAEIGAGFLAAFLDHALDRVTHFLRTLGLVCVEDALAHGVEAKGDDSGE